MSYQKDFHIREFGSIEFSENNQLEQKNNDSITISSSAWKELQGYADDSAREFITYKNSTTLKVQNFVGVLSTQDGTHIEILPKIDQATDLEETRKIMLKMIGLVYKIKSVPSSEARLETFKQPLHEILISFFLDEITSIVKKGIRFDYKRIVAHEKFLKGSLQLTKQINEPPYNQHFFHIEYDDYSANRVENQLIKSALLQLINWAKSLNLKRAKKLLSVFNGIDTSNNHTRDLKIWQSNAHDKNMEYYQDAFPYIRFILNKENPFTQKGKSRGMSFLFPMENLFEEYVALVLKKLLKRDYPSYELKTQGEGERKYLAKKKNKYVFQLKPDIIIFKDEKPIKVLDTKWKLIQVGDGEKDKGNIESADMYQLYAYGKKYNVRTVGLIYPKHSNFKEEITFTFDEELTLKIIYFDLKTDKISLKI